MDDTSFNWRDYVKPKSVTWWSGIAMLTIGMSMMAGLDDVPIIGAIAQFFAAIAGTDASPAALIFGGTGLIGIRAKLGRA